MRRTSGNSRPQRSAGFTLVELLLAITLMSILLGLTYTGLRAATRSSQRGELLLAAGGELRASHQFIRRQLNQMLPLPYAVAEGAEELRVVFEGDARRIQYVAPMPGYLGAGGPQVQRIEIVDADDGELLIQFSHALLQGFEESRLYDREPVVLLEGVSSAGFEFLTEDEEGELIGWTESWDQGNTLPIAVRLDLEFSEGLNMQWPDLAASVRVDEQALRAGGGVSGASNYQQSIQNLIKNKSQDES